LNNKCRIIIIITFSFVCNLTYPFQDSLQTYDTPFELNKDEIVASIGPTNITAEEFHYSYEFGPAFIKRKIDSKIRHLNYMINEKLLALDGYSRNINRNDEVASIIKDFENDLATEEMFKEDILKNVEISEEEIDTVVTQKQLELDIRWLYAQNKEGKGIIKLYYCFAKEHS